jgi:hypothetical protein
MVAVVPVLFTEPKYDWSQYSDSPGARTEFGIGRQFITDNSERSFWFFTWARWACIPFSLLGGYVCYRGARELFGEGSGLLALTLWCFGPYILANGQLITPDMGATALGVTAGYAFWKWLKQPQGVPVPVVGLVLGLLTAALETKLSPSQGQSCGGEERSNQLRLLPQAANGEVKFQMQLFHVHAREVGHLDILQVAPTSLIQRAQIRSVAGQRLQVYWLRACLRQELAYCSPAVNRRSIPDHQQLLARLHEQVLQEDNAFRTRQRFATNQRIQLSDWRESPMTDR